jgi:hypothetical protein
MVRTTEVARMLVCDIYHTRAQGPGPCQAPRAQFMSLRECSPHPMPTNAGERIASRLLARIKWSICSYSLM